MMNPSSLAIEEESAPVSKEPGRLSRILKSLFDSLRPARKPGLGSPRKVAVAPTRTVATTFGRDRPNPPNFQVSEPN